MNTFTKHEVLAYAAELLRKWGDGKMPPMSYCGICANLDELIKGYRLVGQLSPYWHRFSGDTSYPVPYGYALVNLWGNTESGNDRRDLCHFLADEIEEYLETGEC